MTDQGRRPRELYHCIQTSHELHESLAPGPRRVAAQCLDAHTSRSGVASLENDGRLRTDGTGSLQEILGPLDLFLGIGRITHLGVIAGDDDRDLLSGGDVAEDEGGLTRTARIKG